MRLPEKTARFCSAPKGRDECEVSTDGSSAKDRSFEASHRDHQTQHQLFTQPERRAPLSASRRL